MRRALTHTTQITEDTCREAFRLVASNVAVITTSARGPHGCTATAWAEDPRSPFVVTALARAGTTRSMVLESGRFCANVLAGDQADIARRFARPGDRFDGLAYELGPLGLPTIHGAAVALGCVLTGTLEFGTYDLMVGEIKFVAASSPPSLLTFCDQSFGTHVPEARRVP